MTTLTAFLQHSFVGKATQAEPYTASAHFRYISRKDACNLLYTENMPKQYHAAQRFLNAHEDGLRKNGRVIDKFIISIPRGVELDHAAFALKRFGYRLGKGRTPFAFAIHGHGESNYHAHFLFIDRDVETGKRVFQTTARNSTKGIKLEWETAANDTFAQLGYEWRVQVKDGIEAANDNAEPDIDDTPDTEDAREGDDTVDVIDRESPEGVSSSAVRARRLLETVTELNYLNEARLRLADAEERVRQTESRRDRTAFEAGVYQAQTAPALQDAYQAQEALKGHTTSSGKLKGFGLNVFGMEFKSGKRKRAEVAQDRAMKGEAKARYIETTQRDYNEAAEIAANEARAAAELALMRRNELKATYGTDEDMDKAGEIMEATIQSELRHLSLAEVMEAYEFGELTDDEVRAYLIASGNREALAAFEDRDLSL